MLFILVLWAQGSLKAQNFDQEIKKIELLQDRSAYDSALLLANQLLDKQGASSEKGLSLLINKQISFYYLGKYDSIRKGNRALVGKIEANSPLYPNWRFVQALSKAEEMGLAREKAFALERLSWLARDTKDYERAYFLGVDASKIKDSLLSESVKKESLALQERYESERKSNEILLLESANQQFLLIVVFGGIVLFALLNLVFFGLYRQKRLVNEKLIAEAEQRELSRSIQTKDMELTAQALQIYRSRNCWMSKPPLAFWRRRKEMA